MKILGKCDGCGKPGGISYDNFFYCPKCLEQQLRYDGAQKHLKELLMDVMVEFKLAYKDIISLEKLGDMPALIMDEVVRELNSSQSEGVQPAQTELIENAAD